MTLAQSLIEQEEVYDLHSLMFKSPLRVANKILTEEEKMQIINIIERIVEFE